jgi:hypothetical protein
MNNNTFSRAQYIGSFGSRGGGIRAKGSINFSDRVDIFSYTVTAGSSFTVRSSGKSKGGILDLAVYYRNPSTGQPVFANSTTIRPSKSSSANVVFPALPETSTFYMKLSNPTGNVKYDFKLESLGY